MISGQFLKKAKVHYSDLKHGKEMVSKVISELKFVLDLRFCQERQSHFIVFFLALDSTGNGRLTLFQSHL